MQITRSRQCTTTSALAGKSIAITGGNNGIGLETSIEAARAGASHITLLCRSRTGALEAEKLIKKAGPSTNVSIITCDLSDLSTIHEAGSVLKGEGIKFDVLFLNAGAMMQPYGVTKDGFESQIGPNHFGHFLLTHLIRQADLLNEKARVVVLSSNAPAFWPGFDIDDLHWQKRPYSITNAYAASKSANIMMASELQKKFDAEGKGRIAVSLHPGFVRTKVVREASWIRVALYFLYPIYWSISLSPLEGAQCSLYAATTTENIKGLFLNNLRPSKLPVDVSDEIAHKLWLVSEKTLGITN